MAKDTSRFQSTPSDGKTDFRTKNSTAHFSTGDQPGSGEVGHTTSPENPYAPNASTK